MDLNDPRRRLQVLNNASPSIRIASQPQQKLTVAKAPTQPQPQISIAQPKQYNLAVPKNPTPAPAQPQYTNKFKGLTSEGTETKKLFGLDVGQFMGDFGKVTKISAGRDYESNADDFIKSYDGLNDDARRIYVNDVIKKAKAGDEVAINTAKVLNDKGKLTGTFGDFLEAANNKAFGWTMNASNFNKQKDVQDRLDNFTAGQIGKEFDPITVGTDIGLTIAGGMGAAKLLSKIPAAQRVIAAGGTAGKVLPFLADSVGGGLTQEAISQARGRDTSFAQDMATGTAIDVGANLLFKGAGKFVSLFRQGEKSASVVDDIIKEADPARIQQVMKIDNNLANYLAQETNPDTVKEVLRQMDMDPNIQLPDAVRKRLEEEGISAVRKKDNQYGAEYDPNDSSISFKDQSFATDANTYHELGHHIYKNKLTPEEQALFKGTGEASQKAAGREGYTPADVNSEDFSDYMQKALTGRIKEVPEELRPVIAKYAKTAANEAEDLGIAGAKAVDAPTTDFKTKVNSQVGKTVELEKMRTTFNSLDYETLRSSVETLKNNGAENSPAYKIGKEVLDSRSAPRTADSLVVGSKEWQDFHNKQDAPIVEKPKATLQEGRANRVLDKKIRYNGKVMTRSEYVDALKNDGYVATQNTKNGKTTYSMKSPKGDYYDISKIEHAKATAASPQVTKTTIKTYPVGTKISGRTYDGNVYHKTNEASIADITKNGLVPSKKDGRLYFHQTLQENLGWGEDAPIIRTKNENVPDLEIVKTATNNTDAPSSARSISPDKLEVSYDNGKTWKSLAPQVGKETDPKVEAPKVETQGAMDSLAKARAAKAQYKTEYEVRQKAKNDAKLDSVTAQYNMDKPVDKLEREMTSDELFQFAKNRKSSGGKDAERILKAAEDKRVQELAQQVAAPQVGKTDPLESLKQEADPVFGKDGKAWQDYNKRYSGLDMQTAKSEADFNAVSRGDPKVFDKTPDAKRLQDVISGDKKVGYVDNQSYDGLFAKKAQEAGLYTREMNGVTVAGKNKADVDRYVAQGKNLSKQEEHNLIGYKPERFQPKPPKSPIESLKQEARKYKSADEYSNRADTHDLLHRSKLEKAGLTQNEYASLHQSLKDAEYEYSKFSDESSQVVIDFLKNNPDKKLTPAVQKQALELNNKAKAKLDEQSKIMDRIKEIDGDKSAYDQLTDLYNQAHAGAKSAVPTPEQAVGDVSKAQTGTSDAAPDGSVKTTSPEDAGTTFTNQLDTSTENGANALKTAPSPTLGVSPQRAEEIVPNADDETKRAVQEVLDNLNGAQKNFDDAAKIRTQQKAARINSADGAFQSAGGGEAGFRAKLGALKGKYAESGFNPITASESTQNTILNDIESSSLRSFEKLNLQNAMRKIWGATEGKPTPGEINQIRKYFGEDGEQIAKSIEDAIADDPKTWRDRIVDIAGIPRTAMSSFDLSMGLRQGGQVAVRNFPEWVNANKESIKYVKNADYFKSEMKRIADDDAYETIVDKLGVRLPAVEGNSDEIMASANLLEKIPVYGRGIEASDRAYSGGLTKLRYNIAKKWIDSLGGTDEALKNLSEKDLRDIGEVINTSTGSGGKKGGFTEKHMQTLATTLFAPRLWASRLNAINPAYYARLSPIARRRAIENIASFMGAAGVVVGLADAAGMDVEMDPRSSDFMKIKTGNTRFDIFGGLQQNVVFFSRMVTGEKKNSSTGEIQTMGDGFGQPTRLDLAQDMLQNKLNPLLGYAARMLQSSEGDTGNPNDRKDRFGEDLNVAKETGKLVVPLGVQGLVDSYNDTGDPVKAAAMNIPNFFGIGTQTYGETATKDQKTDSKGKIAFGGKIQDNMVLDNDGNVMMDEKNRPIKVKFDKNATETQKAAAKKKAQNEAYTKKAKSLLSQEDADLYATGQADPNSLDQAQKDKFDQIKKWVSDYGKSVDIPKSVKSDAAKNFYAKYNTMTKKDQENWLKESPDENAKTVATELNKQRVKGLPEYKPSNYLSKEYAEYEKDLLEHPEYTNIDKQNKARAFQTKAYKYNYSEDQRDIFNEGGSSDLKSLIDDGQVSKADLDAAIKLDEELYNSGLTGSLKFSKKFRNTYGYGTPAGRGGSGSGGSGGGSGSGESKRAYLSAYVSNGTEGAKKEAPQFSSKRRTTGISFKDVSTPKKSNSKKVTINL